MNVGNNKTNRTNVKQKCKTLRIFVDILFIVKSTDVGAKEGVMYTAIYPGEVWKDNAGKRIQAHGGSVFMRTAFTIFTAKTRKRRRARIRSGRGACALILRGIS